MMPGPRGALASFVLGGLLDEVGIFVRGIEAGAGFGYAGEVLVATDAGVGEELVQGGEEEVQGDDLLGGAGVFVSLYVLLGVAVPVGDVGDELYFAVSAFVTDGDGVGVVALDVAAGEGEGTAVVEGAVATDVEVVAGIGAEAAALVIALQALYGIGLAGTGVGAVEDQGVDAAV